MSEELKLATDWIAELDSMAQRFLGYATGDDNWAIRAKTESDRAELLRSLLKGRTPPADRSVGEWRTIESAPKDGSPVLLQLKSPIPREGRPDLESWAGRAFVGRHPGLAVDGFDYGWNFAAPVGRGGFPDDWFVGWHPLPPTETEER